MKRICKHMSLLLAALMLLSLLTGCGKSMNYSPKEDGWQDNADGNAGDVNNGQFSTMGEPIAPSAPSDEDEEAKDQVENDAESLLKNPFFSTADAPVSTFSADVDTASYTYFRKLVNAGYTKEQLKNSANSFRVEEFINYFDYEGIAPKENELFGTVAELLPCPWNSANRLLRLTLQAESAVECTGNNLVFLIDVSGSMASNDKLPLLKNAFSCLVGSLSPTDKISIVTYSGREEVVLDGCAAADSARILEAITSLRANGSTNGEAGLSEAYRIAEKNLIVGGNNRIIMASDGDLNVGITSESELKRFVEDKRDAGIYLSVMGFGTGNYKDAKMEALADNGNGVYYYIDGMSEAEKVLGTDLLSTLYTVAKDVKLQITFDPSYVTAYRLIGYENRILNEEDFTDDTKDAGEVGAGHQVTVCYELVTAQGAENADTPWMKLAIRYKKPTESLSLLNEYNIGKEAIRQTLSKDTAFLTCVIRTVLLLRGDDALKADSLAAVLEDLNALTLTEDPARAEFRDLIQKLQ